MVSRQSYRRPDCIHCCWIKEREDCYMNISANTFMHSCPFLPKRILRSSRGKPQLSANMSSKKARTSSDLANVLCPLSLDRTGFYHAFKTTVSIRLNLLRQTAWHGLTHPANLLPVLALLPPEPNLHAQDLPLNFAEVLAETLVSRDARDNKIERCNISSVPR